MSFLPFIQWLLIMRAPFVVKGAVFAYLMGQRHACTEDARDGHLHAQKAFRPYVLYDMMSGKRYLQGVFRYAWQQCYHATDGILSSISAMTKIAPVLMRCKCSKKGYLYS